MAETRINETELEEYKHRLFCLRAGLQDLAASSKEATGPAEPDQPASGGLSLMDAIQAQHKAGEPARLRQRQLGKIEGALRRIEDGHYGNCFICGEGIDDHRLSANPTCTRCMKCVNILGAGL